MQEPQDAGDGVGFVGIIDFILDPLCGEVAVKVAVIAGEPELTSSEHIKSIVTSLSPISATVWFIPTLPDPTPETKAPRLEKPMATRVGDSTEPSYASSILAC